MRIFVIVLWLLIPIAHAVQVAYYCSDGCPVDYFFERFTTILCTAVGPIAVLYRQKNLLFAAYCALVFEVLAKLFIWENVISAAYHTHPGKYNFWFFTLFVGIAVASIISLTTSKEKSELELFTYIKRIPTSNFRLMNAATAVVIVFVIIDVIKYFGDRNYAREIQYSVIIILFIMGLGKRKHLAPFAFHLALAAFLAHLPNLIEHSSWIIRNIDLLSSNAFILDELPYKCFNIAYLIIAFPLFLISFRKLSHSDKPRIQQLDQF